MEGGRKCQYILTLTSLYAQGEEFYTKVMANEVAGKLFWARVDVYLSYRKTLKDICEEAGLRFNIINAQRTLSRIPDANDVCLLARAFDIPSEWLLTGETRSAYENLMVEKGVRYARIREITNRLYYSSERDLEQAEGLLGIEKTGTD